MEPEGKKTIILGLNHSEADRRTGKENWRYFLRILKKIPENGVIGIEIPHDLDGRYKVGLLGEMKEWAENKGLRVKGIDTATHFNLRLLGLAKQQSLFYEPSSVKKSMLMNEFRTNHFIRQARKNRFDLIVVGAAHAQDIADFVPNSRLVLPPRTKKNSVPTIDSWAVYEDRGLLELLKRIREKRIAKFPVG